MKSENEILIKNSKKKDTQRWIWIFVITLFICIGISYFRFFSIDEKNSIYYNDGYLSYAKLLKNWIITGENSFIQNSWFQNYDKKNRIFIPFVVAIISIITTFTLVNSGLLFNFLAFLFVLFLIYLSYSFEQDLLTILKALVLFVSINTVTANIFRFSTDITQILFLLAVFYFIKRNKFLKRHFLNYFFISFFMILSILTRESSILFLIAIFFDLFKKWYQIIILIILGILFVFLSYFIPYKEYNVLSILLDALFTTNTAREIASGVNVNYHITRFFEVKTSFYFFYHFTTSFVFSFGIYFIFACILFLYLFYKRKTQFKFELIWGSLYLFFLIFLYSGRVLDRFFLPIIVFSIFPAINGISLLTNFIGNKKKEKRKVNSILINFNEKYPNFFLFLCILFNFSITIIRFSSFKFQ